MSDTSSTTTPTPSDVANNLTPQNSQDKNVTPTEENLGFTTDPERSNELDYVGEPKTVDWDFVYPTHMDPMRQRDPHGIYLDDVQRQNAELQRAKIEKRKPDLKNPPSTQGTPLIPMHVAASSVTGDMPVKADVTLPVSVGIHEDNLDDYGDARKFRDEQDANNDASNKQDGSK